MKLVEISVDAEAKEFTRTVPKGTRILGISGPIASKIAAVVPSEGELPVDEERTFYVGQIGDVIPDDVDYLGSVACGSKHVFVKR